jgi:ketosteroid isomerase-like protein
VDSEYEQFKARPMEVRAGGTPDRVLVEGIVTYGSSQGRPGGAWRSWWVVQVRDEKIARLKVFHDASEALQAAGLSPQ